MFEKKTDQLLPLRLFLVRMAAALGLAMVIILLALGVGVIGYHHFVGLSWIDALLNASMILTGMGPVATMETNGAKVFASAYALFSGVVFLSAVGVLLSPMFHRLLHAFHLDDEEQTSDEATPSPSSRKPKNTAK